MVVLERIERALRSARPYDELRAVASALLDEGDSDQQVYDLFETVRARLRAESREADEDIIMEVMDCLVGWCSPAQDLSRARHPNP